MKTFSMPPGHEQLVPIDCPLCGTDSFRRIWKGRTSFVRCGSCGLVYQNPQPRQEDLASRYHDRYFAYEQENEENFFNLMRLGLKDIGFDQLSIGREKSFLDIGCATGMLPAYMKSLGYEEQGVELCEPASDYGREKRGVRIFSGTLEDAAFKNESFGIVHCSHLIEHLTNPSGFASEVYRILKPGGLFLAATPDIAGFQARIFAQNWRSAIEDHMVLFSRKTLKQLLLRSGFTVLKRRSWGGLGKGTAPLPVKWWADRICKLLNIGDVMIMAAVKPNAPDRCRS